MRATVVGSGRMFAQNVSFIFTLLIAAVWLLIAFVVTWTVLRIWWRYTQRQRVEQIARRAKLRPDGRPYPPADAGPMTGCVQSRQQDEPLEDAQEKTENRRGHRERRGEDGQLQRTQRCEEKKTGSTPGFG